MASTKCGERASEEFSSGEQQEVHRYLGLSLGGAKSDRTCLTVLDYYPKQEKAFVVDVFESIGSEDGMTADQVLIGLIDEMSDLSPNALAVDAPLTLPPCLLGCDDVCEGYETCTRPAVSWMRKQYERARESSPKLKHFTPYSQRPIDLYVRYAYPEQNLFQDETLGANLAPQAARMSYLKKYLRGLELLEVWPKLALYHLRHPLGIRMDVIQGYRHLENGAANRTAILERLVEKSNLFVYERDFKKFIANMDAFDSLLCAWAALQYGLNRVVKFPEHFPLESGWVQIPEL